MGKKKQPHEIASWSLVRVRCQCGWIWRNDFLKGKTDDQLQDESEMEFLKHQMSMRESGL